MIALVAWTVVIACRLVVDICCGIGESIRQTLPSTSEEAGPFTAGMVWAFLVHWTILIAVTWLWAVSR